MLSLRNLAYAQSNKARKVLLLRIQYILKPVLSGHVFVNMNRCISVTLVSEEDKSI